MFRFGFNFSFFFEVRLGSKFDFGKDWFHCSKLRHFWHVVGEVQSSIWSENGSGSSIFQRLEGKLMIFSFFIQNLWFLKTHQKNWWFIALKNTVWNWCFFSFFPLKIWRLPKKIKFLSSFYVFSCVTIYEPCKICKLFEYI